MKKFFGFGNEEDKFDPNRLKINLKMAVSRIRIHQNKIVNSVKAQRRALAELISVGKYDSARVKVEALMREDVSLEGLEALVLFCDLVATRVGVVANSPGISSSKKEDSFSSVGPPPELKESISSILWSSERVSGVLELATVRRQFIAKYGKQFVGSCIANSEFAVNEKILDRLGMGVPSNEAAVRYMEAVATEYGVTFDLSQLSASMGGTKPCDTLAAGTNIDMHDVLASIDTPHEEATSFPKSSTRFVTKSGFVIPPIVKPRDELEGRLLALSRQ
eukprot:GILJ01024239.1.p1 GENE.GILJ01024239.1~~GILJ01024239.1.p1  ORF type:complete len:277 (+),score=47.02 GILJ01024239.1:50-880(+)